MYSYFFTRMYPYVFVCTRMLLVCYSYVCRMLVVCIRMYPYVPYVTRMFLVRYSYVFVCIRMFRTLLVCLSYVSRMYSYVSTCSVCYLYVTSMYSCGVLVMIIISHVLCNYLITPEEHSKAYFLRISKQKFQRVKRTF